MEQHTNLTANGSTEAFKHIGGALRVLAVGNWGGAGSLKLEVAYGATPTWYDTMETALTADGKIAGTFPAALYRLTLSSATSPNLNVFIGSAEQQ